MLLQTNSYIVPKERRAEHARLIRRFRQALARIGCDQFEVYEQVGANWSPGGANGRYVQIMRFRDRQHQQAVQAAERADPGAQQIISEFCDLINFAYQHQHGYFATGFYTSVIPIGPKQAVEYAAEEETADEAPAAEVAMPHEEAPQHDIIISETIESTEIESPASEPVAENVAEPAISSEPISHESHAEFEEIELGDGPLAAELEEPAVEPNAELHAEPVPVPAAEAAPAAAESEADLFLDATVEESSPPPVIPAEVISEIAEAAPALESEADLFLDAAEELPTPPAIPTESLPEIAEASSLPSADFSTPEAAIGEPVATIPAIPTIPTTPPPLFDETAEAPAADSSLDFMPEAQIAQEAAPATEAFAGADAFDVPPESDLAVRGEAPPDADLLGPESADLFTSELLDEPLSTTPEITAEHIGGNGHAEAAPSTPLPGEFDPLDSGLIFDDEQTDLLPHSFEETGSEREALLGDSSSHPDALLDDANLLENVPLDSNEHPTPPSNGEHSTGAIPSLDIGAEGADDLDLLEFEDLMHDLEDPKTEPGRHAH